MNRRSLLGGASLLLPGVARAQGLLNGPAQAIGGQPPPVVPGSGVVGPGGLPGPSLDLQFTAGVLDPRITYTGANGTYFNAAGVLTAATTNVPRFDYDPVLLTPRGLLIEGARTNLLLNSATLSTQSVTTAAAAYALSFYGTGTIALSGAFVGTLAGTGAFPTRSTLLFTATAAPLVVTVTGSVLNAQLEAGGFVTSYIPTTSAAVTRAADVATMPVGSWFNAAAMSIVSEATSAINQAGNAVYFSLSDNTTNNYVLGYIGGATPRFAASGSGAAMFNAIDASTVTTTTIVKLGVSLLSGASVTTFNGVTGIISTGSYSNTFTLIGINRLDIGYQSPYGGQLNGYLRRVRFWPRALGSAELQAVTT